MCLSYIVGFVASLGLVSSIVGASQLAIVVIYYAELPPIFLVLSLVTGTFVFTLSSCIVGSIIPMIRNSVNISGKIGVTFALGLMSIITSVNLLLLLLQCHWILDQKVLTDIGPFQLQCLKSFADISEGIFLLILTNSFTLGISIISLPLTCFWKVRKHPDVFQISVLSSNWVYENNSDNTNNVSENDETLSNDGFRISRRFGNTNVQIPKINFKSTRKGNASSSSISSNNQLLRNISSYCPESPEQPIQSFAEVLALNPPQPCKASLLRLSSFAPADVKETSEHHYKHPCTSPVNEFNESNCTENNTSTIKCTYPLQYPNTSMNMNDPRLIANSEDISHWLTKGKWRKNLTHRSPGTQVRILPPVTPGYSPPSLIDAPLNTNEFSADELVTPRQVVTNLPRIEITPPNEELIIELNAAIHSLDSVLHLTPSVSTASYRNSNSPQSAGSSPILSSSKL